MTTTAARRVVAHVTEDDAGWVSGAAGGSSTPRLRARRILPRTDAGRRVEVGGDAPGAVTAGSVGEQRGDDGLDGVGPARCTDADGQQHA